MSSLATGSKLSAVPPPPRWRAVGIGIAMLAAAGGALEAQELIPAAYTPAPIGVNFIGIGATSNRGDVAFDPSGPIDEAVADISLSTLTYARTFGLFDRSATATVILPYVVGDIEGLYLGEPAAANRSGTGDLVLRFGLNLLGASAMTGPEFASYKPKTLIGTWTSCIRVTDSPGASVPSKEKLAPCRS